MSQRIIESSERGNRFASRKRTYIKQLIIQLWRNSAEHNLSVQVNDKRCGFVTLKQVEQFVAQCLGEAKKSLLEPSIGRTH
jgi:hypothetical protein